MFDLRPHDALPQELEMFRASIRRFVDRELIPLEHAVSPDGQLAPEAAEAVRDKAQAAGFWMMDVPEELGGQGLSLLALAVFWEEIARTSAVSARDHSLFGPTVGPILLGLTGAQREAYLIPVLEGRKRACFAQTEPDAGSDPASMRTRAERIGDRWRVNGVKRFITRAATADFAQVFAVTDPARGARGGISCFLVDMNTPGVSLGSADATMMGDVPREIVFENAEIPAENLVGIEGQGFALAQHSLNHGRVRHAAHACGAMERSLALAATYAAQRRTFGERLADRQGVQWMLADGYAGLYATRLMTYDAARKTDAGLAARAETFMAKIYGVETGYRVVDSCLQLHGALGLTGALPLERFWRDLRSFRITEGPTEVLKTTLARAILKDVERGA